MALFPAYASGSSTKSDEETTGFQSFKFASFKPPSPAPEIQKSDVITLDDSPGPSEDDDIEIIDEKRSASPVSYHRKRRKRKEKKRKRRHRSSSSSADSSSPERKPVKKSTPPQPTTIPKWSLLKSKKPTSFEANDQPIFIADNRREVENLQFGTVYKLHLAKFPVRFRQCYGNSSQRIDRLFFGQGFKNDGNSGRYFNTKSLRPANIHITNIKLKPATEEGASSSVELLPEFVPLDDKMIVDGETYVYDPKLQMYRRPETDAQRTENYLMRQEDLLYPPSATDPVSMENQRLNRLLSDNPHDIKLWKEFIRLQDRLLYDQRSKNRLDEKPLDFAVLERKLSVLEKAIEKNPTNVEFKLLRLNIAREMGWDSNRVRDEWRKLEFAHVNDPSMWIGRLQFERGGYFTGFSFTRQSQLYDHCSERFATILSGQVVTHPPPPNGEHYLVDFLFAKIRFLLDSGHTEQAIGSIQALLEFNFNRPPALDAVPWNEKRQFFEPFWDSNQPRIGDENAAGWTETVKGSVKSAPTPPDSSAEEDAVCRKNSNLRDAGLWLELERFRESKQWLPWLSAEEPDDPQLIVFYDDIAGILYDIREPWNRFRSILESLTLCGVRLPSLYSSNHDQWYDEESAFRSLDIFGLLPALRRPTYLDIDQFLNRLCSAWMSDFPDSPYRLYLVYIRFEHSAFSLLHNEMSAKERLKQYRRMAKSILDDDRWRNQLVFYEAYANGLNLLGAFQEASNVAETALIASKSGENVDDHLNLAAVLRLINIWMENRLFNHNGASNDQITDHVATWILTGTWPEKPAATPTTTLLKARTALAERLAEWQSQNSTTASDEFINSWLGSKGTLLAHLAAMFNYDSSQGNVNNPRSFYKEMRQYLKNSMDPVNNTKIDWQNKDSERLWTWEIRLIEHHLHSNPSSPPRMLSQCLEEALQEFPSNPTVLKSYVDKHLSGQLMVKLRRFFDRRLDEDKNNAVNWIAAVYSEFTRYVKLKDEQSVDVVWSTGSGSILEANRLRSVLARSVESCPNSVVLWRLRLKLESHLSERESVKRIFYLAIRQCPWAKDLYMDAVGLLPDEGQSIVDLMLEKGLRIRIPWEELQLLRKAAERDLDANADLN